MLIDPKLEYSCTEHQKQSKVPDTAETRLEKIHQSLEDKVTAAFSLDYRFRIPRRREGNRNPAMGNGKRYCAVVFHHSLPQRSERNLP
jgi:hypothetical protein